MALLIIFYVICCFYFFFSALQIKHGHQELTHTYFMMDAYTSWNRRCQYLFMAMPVLFELRVLIDWCSTRTSLDVF
jgi:hypothetical protein